MNDTSAFSHLPYRACVGIMLINADSQVFVAQRLDQMVEAWQMPQGGIDAGEDAINGALRELREETSVTQATLLAESAEWMNYDLPDYLIPELWGGKYRGQTQKWFLMRLDAPDSHININTEIPEFRAWKWVDPAELADLAVPFKRDLYQNLVNEFSSRMRS